MAKVKEDLVMLLTGADESMAMRILELLHTPTCMVQHDECVVYCLPSMCEDST